MYPLTRALRPLWHGACEPNLLAHLPAAVSARVWRPVRVAWVLLGLVLLAGPPGVGAAAPTGTDRTALEALYDATGGDSWMTKTRWKTDAGNWYGVTTDSAGNVTQLDLVGNNLVGSIPPKLGDLTSLIYLFLHENNLSGPIPPDLGKLTNLTRLYLRDNALSGAIPGALGNLANLEELYLERNSLREPIPEELGKLARLEELALNDNHLSGAIPATWGTATHPLPELRKLYLYDNALSGAIPGALGGLANLKELWLRDNALSGAIPGALGGLANLEWLYLDSNSLSGPIPPELGKLTKLTILSLPNNQLSGPIPPDLGKLTALNQLNLRDNALSGPIPEELGNLTKLTVLSLPNNQLSGLIPPALGELAKLRTLDLHNNDLGGPIPPDLGKLTALTKLDLSNNALSGAIPATWGTATHPLPNLQELRLFNNARYINAVLSGPLPASFADLPNLGKVYVQNTQVTLPPALASWAAVHTVRTGIGAASSGTIALDPANANPFGLWADATTLYVSDGFASPPTVFAYRLADGSHDPDNDLALAIENADPEGLWGNDTTLWVADYSDQKLYAYNLATGLPDSGNDIALDTPQPTDLWSDGETVWVLDYARNVYAYTLDGGIRDTTKDFPPGSVIAANGEPRAVWSDGTTLWVADRKDARLYAYELAGGRRAATLDRPLDPANARPQAVWSDGTTLWVADRDPALVYVYVYVSGNHSPEAVGTLPDLALTVEGRQEVRVAPAFRDPDGEALRYRASGETDDVAVAGKSADGVPDKIFVFGTGLGTTTITVTAWDRAGEMATQQFTVTVVAESPPNQGPQAVGVLPDLALGVYGTPYPVGVAGVLQDPDGDALTVTAASSNRQIATVRVTGTEISVHPVAGGMTTITVTATEADGANRMATQRFEVTVIGPRPSQPPEPPEPPPEPPEPPEPPGRGGGGGGSRSQDRHGNTAGQATRLPLGPPAPWTVATPGQIAPANDVDYFTFDLPAGILVVETTGSTATRGTVWQDGEEVATADSGGERRNFRLSVRVAAGPVVLAVAGNGRQTGAYTVAVRLVAGYLENPGRAAFQSGIGVLSGWVCEADEVEIEMEAEQGVVLRYVAAYGTERLDTEPVCGGTDNGFGLLFNWNRLGEGEHTVVAYVDDIELGRARVTVTTLGEEFVRGVAGTCEAENFPTLGETVLLEWQQTSQNFVIAGGTVPSGENHAGSADRGYLENPGPNSFQSGIGVLSGWVCEAAVVEIVMDDLPPQVAGYGTERLDTQEACGDTDNGFGLLFNWNRLGEGEHTVVAFVDDVELGRATVRVTTLGEEFLRDVAGECEVEDFPMPGERVTLEWQQNSQNFVMTDVE